MKISHENTDHRPTRVLRVKVYYIDPETQKHVDIFAQILHATIIAPHMTVGVEAELEPIEAQA